jgi:hypothetical protein
MKTITALIIIVGLFVWGPSIIQAYTAKMDYHHCIKLKVDEVLTDAEVQALINKCEASSGYTQELLP